jgi:hypothetical protein
MPNLTLLRTLEILAVLATIGVPIVTSIIWLLREFKKKIITELREEIDRNQMEIQHLNCWLEQNCAGFTPLMFSGVWRSIFFQRCDELQNRDL